MDPGQGLGSRLRRHLARRSAYDAEVKQIAAILAQVKAASLQKKGLLEDAEFLAIVSDLMPGRVS